MDANFVDENKRNLVSLVCQTFGDETVNQLNFLIKKCKVNATTKDK
jgi:hypothetical protein